MSPNKRKNIALIVAAGVLFLAFLDGWEYGFFTILRFVVFATTAYVAWLAFESKKEKWVWLLGFVAVLFNPFIPIFLEHETWMVIDFVVAVLLIGVVFLLKLSAVKNGIEEAH